MSCTEKNFLTCLAIVRSYNPKTDRNTFIERTFNKLSKVVLNAMIKNKLVEYVKCKNRHSGGYYKMSSRNDWQSILA